MSSIRSFFFFFALNLNICLGTFIMGYFLTVYNPLQEELDHIYGWTGSMKTFYEGVITSLIPLGAIIANLFSSHLIEYFGRKRSCLLIDAFCIISTILTLFENLPLLIIGRFLCGVSVGVNSVLVGIYMKEISPKEHVHFFASLGGFMLNFGMVGSFLFGINTLKESELDQGVTSNWWRVMFAFPIVLSLLRSLNILVFFNFESPSYLIRKEKEQNALAVLKSLYKDENLAEELLLEMKAKVEKYNLQKSLSYSDLFTRKYLMRFLISLTLVFGNQYSGVNAIAFYSKSLFSNLSGSDATANYLNGLLGAVNLISGLLIVFPLKHLGVKKTYLISCMGSAITLSLVALFVLLDLKIVSLVFIFGYYFFFSIGIGPIIFMTIPQLLPEKFISVVFTFFWMLAFVIGLTFPLMLSSSMGVDGSFFFFSCCCVFAFVFNFFKFPDTTGKTVEEVALIYEGKERDPFEENTSC